MLNDVLQYTIKVYVFDATAQIFYKWFTETFLVQNPGSNLDFEMEIYKEHALLDEHPKPMLEITAHNPFFTIESLEELFRANVVMKKDSNVISIRTDLN